jgi:hypothetical protein
MAVISAIKNIQGGVKRVFPGKGMGRESRREIIGRAKEGYCLERIMRPETGGWEL